MTIKRENIKVQGHKGTWYVIAEREYEGMVYFLLEHEKYGEDVASVIVNEDGELIVEDVWNGFDDLEEYFDYMLYEEA